MGLIPAEEARRALWLEQRAARIAKRAELEALMAGDPAAVAASFADFAPVLGTNPVEDEFPESKIVVNHNIW